MFYFSFLHHLEKLWSLNSIILYAEYMLCQNEKNGFLMVWYHIVSYRYHFVSISIVSYHKKIKGTHPYAIVNILSRGMECEVRWDVGISLR